MKFSVSSSLLNERLQTAAKFISAKPAIPIYGLFLFSIEGNTLTITASDSDTSLSTKLDIANQGGDGRFAVQSKVLNDVLKELHEQDLLFDIDDHNYSVVMTTDCGSYKFIAQNASEYVEFSGLDGDDTKAFQISSSVLIEAITKTSFAITPDEIHPIMNGICILSTDKGLVFVATDGHRLSKFTLEKNPNLPHGFVVPVKAANLLKNVLAKEVGNVDVFFDNKFIIFQAPAYTMISRQIEGVYPKFEAVIPQNFNMSVIVNREALISSLRRIQVCATQGNHLIKLRISNGAITVFGQDIDFATSGEETLKCSYEGQELEIGFRSSFAIDALSNLDCDDVEMRLIDQTRPTVFVPVQKKEGIDCMMLVMPMMLN